MLQHLKPFFSRVLSVGIAVIKLEFEPVEAFEGHVIRDVTRGKGPGNNNSIG